MKKMLFSAIAMVAFAGTMNAQSDGQDSDFCKGKRDKYKSDLRKGGGKTAEEIGAAGDSFYNGCMDGRKSIRRDLQQQAYKISR